MLFKESAIILAPKTKFYFINDYRPVTLTSVAMKTFENFALTYLKSLLSATFDPFKFAHCANRSSADVVSVWLHKILAHLEKKGSYMRTLIIIDYSSHFNTTIPAKLHSKLLTDLTFLVTIYDWILDFFLCRKQTPKNGNLTSRSKMLNTGTPQSCVLSPLLYSLFTVTFKASFLNMPQLMR